MWLLAYSHRRHRLPQATLTHTHKWIEIIQQLYVIRYIQKSHSLRTFDDDTSATAAANRNFVESMHCGGDNQNNPHWKPKNYNIENRRQIPLTLSFTLAAQNYLIILFWRWIQSACSLLFSLPDDTGEYGCAVKYYVCCVAETEREEEKLEFSHWTTINFYHDPIAMPSLSKWNQLIWSLQLQPATHTHCWVSSSVFVSLTNSIGERQTVLCLNQIRFQSKHSHTQTQSRVYAMCAAIRWQTSTPAPWIESREPNVQLELWNLFICYAAAAWTNALVNEKPLHTHTHTHAVKCRWMRITHNARQCPNRQNAYVFMNIDEYAHIKWGK